MSLEQIARLKQKQQDGELFGFNFGVEVLQPEFLAAVEEFRAAIIPAAGQLGYNEAPGKNKKHISILHFMIDPDKILQALTIFQNVVAKVVKDQKLVIEFSRLYNTNTGEVGKSGHTWFDWWCREKTQDGAEIDTSFGRIMQQIQVELHKSLDENGIRHYAPLPRCVEVATPEQQDILQKNGVNNLGNLNDHSTLVYFRKQMKAEDAKKIQEVLPQSCEMSVDISAGGGRFGIFELTFDGQSIDDLGHFRLSEVTNTYDSSIN